MTSSDAMAGRVPSRPESFCCAHGQVVWPAACAAHEDDEDRYLGIPAKHVEYLCRVMHDAYEAEAARVGWATQDASRKPWEDVPHENKQAMRAGVRALLHRLFVPEEDR